ncbi:MAG TPA: ABC transporter ATP-binding protein [Pseudonocardiaceae bacterium]|nr:ABC transporter ATP-binding protein [Pseudonocardiaceae bacterium]
MSGTVAATRPVALSARAVSKTYESSDGSPVHVVDEFSGDLRGGEFVSLVGPSGCGKTTLLRMLTGLVSCTSGTVEYRERGGGVPPGEYGMAFQTPALLPWLRVLPNVLLPVELLRRDRRAALERARTLLRLVGLQDFERRYPHELSGGMQSRVALARALIHDPDVLFMDEPFAALDALTRDDLALELQRLHMHEHKTVLFVTHSIAEALLLSDRVVVLSHRPARVLADIAVDLPRPRSLDDQSLPAFVQLEQRIRGLLRRPHDEVQS